MGKLFMNDDLLCVSSCKTDFAHISGHIFNSTIAF